MAMIGIPGIYIHSLLGSRNDLEGVKRTGRARSINREQLILSRLDSQLADPNSLRSRVFAALRRLLEIRARQPVFHPDADQEILDLGPAFFALRRTNPRTGDMLVAIHNMTNAPQTARALHFGAAPRDILTGETAGPGPIPFLPYQFRWLSDSLAAIRGAT